MHLINICKTALSAILFLAISACNNSNESKLIGEWEQVSSDMLSQFYDIIELDNKNRYIWTQYQFKGIPSEYVNFQNGCYQVKNNKVVFTQEADKKREFSSEWLFEFVGDNKLMLNQAGSRRILKRK